MDRSSYPTRVEVRSGDLGNTETSKSYHILRRLIDTAQPGVVSGLTVTQSAVSVDRFDIALGFGYAPNGELVELDDSVEGQATGLATGSMALVGLMYREVAGIAGAAETEGVARTRRVVRSAEVKVFTADQWAALPTSYDLDLTVDAQDRFLVCAGVERPAVETDPLIITLPPTFALLKSCPQPQTITGIAVTNISTATPNSDPFPAVGSPDNGVIRFEPATLKISWAAPFDTTNLGLAAPFNVAGFGTPQTISSSGSMTLTSANGIHTITILVDKTLLPTGSSGSSVDENLAVTTLYAPTATRHSARDDYHRHLTGSYVSSEDNPHGTRLTDIQAMVEQIYGTLQVGSELTNSLGQGDIPRLQVPANTNIDHASNYYVSHLAEILGVVASRSNNLPHGSRLYQTNSDGLLYVWNCRVLNTSVGTAATIVRSTAYGDDPNDDAFGIELDPLSGTIKLYSHAAAAADTWTTSTWQTTEILHSLLSRSTVFDGDIVVQGDNGGTNLIENNTGHLGYLELGGNFTSAAADFLTSRLRMAYGGPGGGGGERRHILLQSDHTGLQAERSFRLYRANTGYDSKAEAANWTMNALWDAAANKWTKANTYGASMLQQDRDSLFFLLRAGGSSSPFDDVLGAGGWETLFRMNSSGFYTSGNIEAGGAFVAPSILLTGSAPDPLTADSEDRLYSDLLVRGWAKVRVTLGAPPTVPGTTPHVGVSGVSVVTGQTYRGHVTNCTAIRITLDRPMASSNSLIPMILCLAVTGTTAPATPNIQLEAVPTGAGQIDVFDLDTDDPNAGSWQARANATEVTFWVGWMGVYP